MGHPVRSSAIVTTLVPFTNPVSATRFVARIEAFTEAVSIAVV